MIESIHGEALEELKARFTNNSGAERMVLVEHKPHSIRHGKVIFGPDFSDTLTRNWSQQDDQQFSRYPGKEVRHFGVLGANDTPPNGEPIGTAHCIKIRDARMITEAENAPPTVTTIVTDEQFEQRKTFGWVQEVTHAGLWNALGENMHGHNYFPHLVARLQHIMNGVPLAYHASDMEAHIQSLEHHDFMKMVGLRRVFLLMYWAGLAEKKWLVTHQPDLTDYYFPLYLTKPEALRRFLGT